ncbi:hypothetical protein ACFW17_07490 [Streptomyces sp. NPDC058961]|uniref:hypothetical protein n=1 Tax=Streptomyces sp. NPDC058961 TaxID=3346680 RepID=UPI0036B9A0F6
MASESVSESKAAAMSWTISPGNGGVAVDLPRDGTAVYPAVEIVGTEGVPLGVHRVSVTLPSNMGLRFGSGTNPDYTLTVWNKETGRAESTRPGTLSPDMSVLTFDAVDLGPGGKSDCWVTVHASYAAPATETALTFTVGSSEASKSSSSTPLRIL